MITEDLLFDGYCPQCSLKGKRVDLKLNDQDFWECEVCHLQGTSFSPLFAILGWRGEGKFKTHEQKASYYYQGLLLCEASREKGRDIYPDERELLQNSFDLEEYLQSVYPTVKEYHNDKFDYNDPVLKAQKEYLVGIATQEWVDLIMLYKDVKEAGHTSEAFQLFQQKLYDLRIIFDFPWNKWQKGWQALQDAEQDFSRCTLMQLSMYLTAIFRSDRFSEGSIGHYLQNGVTDRLMARLEQLT